MSYVHGNDNAEVAQSALDDLVSEWRERGEEIESLKEKVRDLESDLDTAERQISNLEGEISNWESEHGTE